MRRIAVILLLSLLALTGCQDERQRAAFCENEGVRLLVGGSIAFSYEPNTCQLAFSRDRREFRAFTDSMSDFFVASGHVLARARLDGAAPHGQPHLDHGARGADQKKPHPRGRTTRG